MMKRISTTIERAARTPAPWPAAAAVLVVFAAALALLTPGG